MLYFSRWKSILIWAVVLGSVLVALPNLFSNAQLADLPSWMPRNKVDLGLDLRGGSHIMLKIERSDIVKERLETTIVDMRTMLRDAGVRYTGLSGVGQAVQVRISDAANVEAAKTALKPLTDPISTGAMAGGSIQESELSEAEGGLLRLDLTDAGIKYRLSSALNLSIEVVRRRVGELGDLGASIQRQGSDRVVVQVSGLGDPQRLKSLLSQTGKLSFRTVDASMSAEDAINNGPPAVSEVLYTQDDPAIPYLLEKRALASGADLLDAQATFNAQTNEPVVSLLFGSTGAERLGQATGQNAARTLAIVLDGQVISVVKDPIIGGRGQISGDFSTEGASDLAVLLRSGALPATLTVVEERTVVPSLGMDSIEAGVDSAVIAAGLVVALMLGLYGFFGFLAVVALFANVIMIVAVLTVTGSTLTLPGIAGIVLTIGMAVDANVLIYERIREEYRSGKGLVQAIDTGFSRAFTTIIDANMTTLIAAGILFYLGSGAVRGFSVTVAIGIITTVFTAFTLTRWLFATWVRTREPRHLPRGVRTGIFDGIHIPFMGIRRYTFLVAAALTIASLLGLATVGMTLGIDFNGGSIIEVKARSGDADIVDIRNRLDELNLGDIQAENFGNRQTALIRIQSQDGGENAEQSAITLVRGELEDAYEFRRVEVVGPSVSSQLTRTATLGVLAALAAILVYIWLRFEWQFALGAVIATLHDVILTMGLFVLFGIEFNFSSIAALLTIVGYSLNDTVVVYDRMRDNLKRYTKMPLNVLIDASINQTLSRTILTSVTTMLALAALYIFGGEVIRAFAFVMLFGVIVGTFSSIYIAAPVLIAFRLRPDRFQNENQAKAAVPMPVVPKRRA